jgi:hypothetical protein
VSAQYIGAEDLAAHLQILFVESSDSIENVKQKIQDTQAIPPAQMILQYNGMIMLDGRTLTDYNVVPASTINFFVTPVIVSIIPGETTLTVTWDSPVGTTDNYGQNTGFIATTFGNLSCTAVATTCTIEHAQSSTTYFVTVASTNSTGPNVPSPSLSATTLAATPTTTTTTTPPALPLVPEHSLASTGSATTELFLGGTVLVLLGALLARVTVSIQRRSTR